MHKLIWCSAVAVAGLLITLVLVTRSPDGDQRPNPPIAPGAPQHGTTSAATMNPRTAPAETDCAMCGATEAEKPGIAKATQVPQAAPTTVSVNNPAAAGEPNPEHEDKEIWDAVQATSAERELARQANAQMSRDLDQATEELQQDQLIASEYKDRIREVALRQRERLVQIFGEERATRIRAMQRERAQQFIDSKAAAD